MNYKPLPTNLRGKYDSLELRKKGRRKQINLIWKDRAHEMFDLIWEVRKYCSKKEAYSYLSEFLEIQPKYCHMTFLKRDECKKVIIWSIDILNKGRKLDNEYGKKHWKIIPIPEF